MDTTVTTAGRRNPKHLSFVRLGIGLYTAPDDDGNRTLIGNRAPIGGERSKYVPHVGKKEIAKHERRAEIAIIKRARVDARIDAIAARYPEANNFHESGVYIV